MTFSEEIAALAQAKLREVVADRERYITAWVAETGLHPSDCVLVERIDGPTRVVRAVPGPKIHEELARLRAALEDIASAGPSLCDQTPYWAKWALEGKDVNGEPVK